MEAAWGAISISPCWKEQCEKYLRRMREPNLAIVAIARKLLVAAWYVLQGKTDKYAEEAAVAQKLLRFAYTIGKENRPKGQTAAQFARIRLDRLGLGSELTSISWGSKKPIPLPPSALEEKKRSDVPNTN